MSLGILRHSRSLAEKHVGWKLQEIGRGIVGDFRHVLSEEWESRECNDRKHKAKQQTTLHKSLPEISSHGREEPPSTIAEVHPSSETATPYLNREGDRK